jgi:hypothetical protein
MTIYIYDWGRGTYDDYKYLYTSGLIYANDRNVLNAYEVIDEKLFMLAVIKLGIQFKEIEF